MENKGKLISVVIVLVFIFGALYYFLRNYQPKPVYHQAIKLSLNQTGNNQLEMYNMTLESTYAEEAKNNPNIQNYYQAKILTKENGVLFNTQIPKTYEIATFTYAGYEALPPQTVLNSQIDLYLPFYPNAEKAVIEDENGNTIMSINLKNITTESTPEQNLCGNGICDQTESRFNCDADCQ